MKMQQYITSRIIWTLLVILVVSTTIQSCGNSEESLMEAGEAMVNISLVTVDSNEEDVLLASNKATKVNADLTSAIPSAIAFSNSSTIDVSMTNNAPTSGKLLASSNKVAAAVKTPLGKGITYKLLIYSNEGVYIDQRTYIYGNESSVAAIKLDAGKNYTFVAYSVNHASNLPNVTGQDKLSTAKIDQVNADLMYFKKNIKLVYGMNNLNVVLKHQFSEITTRMTMDANTTGAFTTIANAFITPTHKSASLLIENDQLVYNDINSSGVAVSFPALGTAGLRIVTSNPTILIHPTSTVGSLNFGKITIDGETKENVKVSNLKINPGYKYNLNLNFKTCTQDVSGGDDLIKWRYAEVIKNKQIGIIKDGVFYKSGSTISQTIIAPAADYGFVFDMTELDNAFNMKLNNVQLAVKEIQFEKGASSAQNIRFKDKSLYQGTNSQGGANIDAVYNMIGTSSKPLVKVVISRTGEVTMFGSKVSGGPLYELELFNGNSFNKFSWNSTTTNKVEITQLVDGRTIMIGTGLGKKKITCK